MDSTNPYNSQAVRLEENNTTPVAVATSTAEPSQAQCSPSEPMNLTETKSAPSAPREPLFKVKKWNAVALWKWDVHSDVCAICRAHVMEACPTCQSDNKTSDCVIAWGNCSHSFHNCCIVKWTKRNNRCPLCQQEWVNCRKLTIDQQIN